MEVPKSCCSFWALLFGAGRDRDTEGGPLLEVEVEVKLVAPFDRAAAAVEAEEEGKDPEFSGVGATVGAEAVP